MQSALFRRMRFSSPGQTRRRLTEKRILGVGPHGKVHSERAILTKKRILAVGRICLLGFRLRPSRKTIWGSWQRERSTKGLSQNSMHCHSAVSVRAGRSGVSSNAGRSDLLTCRSRVDVGAPLDRTFIGSYRERPSARGGLFAGWTIFFLQDDFSAGQTDVSHVPQHVTPLLRSPRADRPVYICSPACQSCLCSIAAILFALEYGTCLAVERWEKQQHLSMGHRKVSWHRSVYLGICCV